MDGIQGKIQKWVMKTILVVGLCFVSSVQADDALFDVKIPLSDQDAHLGKQKQFDKALSEAASVELMRLTGRLDINDKDEFQELLSTPTEWLSRYSYQPIIQEGVTVGSQIDFLFDKKQIYQYFQKHNLIVWPYEKRPTTVVFGSQKLGNDVTNLTVDALDDNPGLDYAPPAERLGLPVVEPSSSIDMALWIYPQVQVQVPTADQTQVLAPTPETTTTHAQPQTPSVAPAVVPSPQIAFLINQAKADNLMTYQEELMENGDKTFHWELYDKTGAKVLEGQSDNIDGLQNLKDVFSRMLSFYSQTYRSQADILGAITLKIDNIKSADKLTTIENQLNNVKPMVHSVRLHSLQNFSASFEIVYQGIYGDLLSTIQKMPHVVVTDDDAVIGVVNAKWSDQILPLPAAIPDVNGMPNNQSDDAPNAQQNTTAALTLSVTPATIVTAPTSSNPTTQSTASNVLVPKVLETNKAVIDSLPAAESVQP